MFTFLHKTLLMYSHLHHSVHRCNIFFSEFLKTSNAIAVAPNPRSYCRCSRRQIPFVRTTLSSVSLTEMPGKVQETDHCVTFGVQTSLQSNVSSSNDNSLVKDSLHRSTKDAALNVNMLYFRYQFQPAV